MDKQLIAQAIRTVSTTVEFNGDAIIISAGTEERLRGFMEMIVEPVGEIRETGVVVGPLVGIQPIADLMSNGTTRAAAFAANLGTRQIGDEITNLEEREAKNQGLVVVFGYSDDVTELRGAIHDEVGLGTITLTDRGKIMSDENIDSLDVLKHEGICTDVQLRTIEATYSPHTYKTDIPHATFDVMEDGELFCKGIVFAISDLAIQ